MAGNGHTATGRRRKRTSEVANGGFSGTITQTHRLNWPTLSSKIAV
jgi:hypothetical protein